MWSHSELIKLASLHAKTDQELTAVIDGALERAFELARREPAEGWRACAEAAKLLPAVRSSHERQRLETKLEDLCAALDSGTLRVRASGGAC